ncbi:hypothetical protein CC80DRAFT_88433 [Byssothecium circinans]|uniref:Uncharacterized protein n=1 Tax=Byssothecium circinans TaxID=147558 RepID=A0A6A5TTT0_9PLEO|nr:hypothetical protein CC80DRAFT_88433 [Byssothecium circinans]
MDVQPPTVIPKPLTSLRSLEAAITLKGRSGPNAWFIPPIPVIIVQGHSSIVVSLESTSRHTPDLSNALTLTANSKSEVSGVNKILSAISATCTSRPILWNLTSLSNATLKIAREPLQGATTISDISRGSIQTWAEILYKQPNNLIDNRTLYQLDKRSLSSSVPLWTKCDAEEGRVYMSPRWNIFDGVLDSLDEIGPTWKELPLKSSAFNELNAVNEGNHWRREAPVIRLKDSRGYNHIWGSLIMALIYILPPLYFG